MSAERHITVTLEPALEDFVREQAKRGAFSSSSDYVHELLRQRFEQDRQHRLQDLDSALDRGIADADAGRVKSSDATFNDLRKALGLDQHGS